MMQFKFHFTIKLSSALQTTGLTVLAEYPAFPGYLRTSSLYQEELIGFSLGCEGIRPNKLEKGILVSLGTEWNKSTSSVLPALLRSIIRGTQKYFS
jgi:hypothetical protein